LLIQAARLTQASRLTQAAGQYGRRMWPAREAELHPPARRMEAPAVRAATLPQYAGRVRPAGQMQARQPMRPWPTAAEQAIPPPQGQRG